MSAILEGNIGHGGLPILGGDYIPKNNIPTTDDIASRYGKRIMQGISAKLLKFSKTLIPPVFTQEEMAYIKKDAEDNDPTAEVKVITPDPTITLKKGNTEINIKNAATLVKKMEEIYPTGMNEDKRANFCRQPFINESIKYGIEQGNEVDENPLIVQTKPTIQSPDIKTVNKNAYEIRTDILEMALDWVKYKAQNPSTITDDDVLNTAYKFYRFVENRR